MAVTYCGSHSVSRYIFRSSIQRINKDAMKSTFSIVLVVVVFLILPLLVGIYFYNNIVNKDEEVFGAWAQVESNYQRRADLIPNLVKNVSAHTEHENKTITNVIEARAENQKMLRLLAEELVVSHSSTKSLMATSADVKITAKEFLKLFEEAQLQLGGVMGHLLAAVEAYPDLRSSDQMIAFQAQLEGTENRIKIARIKYNRKVEEFNQLIRKHPGRLIAIVFNFQRKTYFQSQSIDKDGVSVEYK